MVGVLGKELVPYDADSVHNRPSPSVSPSIVIDSSSPTEDEDSQSHDRSIVLRCSRESSSSDSDVPMIGIVNVKTSQSFSAKLLEACESIEEVENPCFQEVLEDHIRYPPQHNLEGKEDIPATRERINYFLKVLNLKIKKYNQLPLMKIPQNLKSVPLALSYETFITLYWPGAINCCSKNFKSSQSYSTHYYKKHKPSFPPLNLPCITSSEDTNHRTKLKETPSKPSTSSQNSDHDSDIISVSDDGKSHRNENNQLALTQSKVYRQQKIQFGKSDRTELVAKKRALSPASRPGPLSHKVAKLNQTVATIDSSVESGDERATNNNNKRIRKQRRNSDDVDSYEQFMDQLNADQLKLEPQHEPGAPENFVATQSRINYFNKVIAVKLEKYNSLNSSRPTSPSRHIPLALSLAGFMQYYWPGQVQCCGIVRENSRILEKHIGRCHRPPKNPPVLSPVPGFEENTVHNSRTSPSISLTPPSHQTSTTSSVRHKNSKSELSDKEIPAAFLQDQHKFPTQHKPGEPEDFLANQESIDYFLDALKVKREKYMGMKSIQDKPLSGNTMEFVLHYWPGVLSCCDQLFTTCRKFSKHLAATHYPPKGLPRLAVVDEAELATATEESSVPDSQPDTAAEGSSLSLGLTPQSQRNGSTTIEPPTSRNGLLSPNFVTNFPSSSHQLMIDSIHDESRQLRAKSASVSSINGLMLLLKRLLELSASICQKIRGMDVGCRSSAVECLEYVFNATKTAIVRGEDLKGATDHDCPLFAIKYAYGTLPAFINWEQNKYLEMLNCVIVLSLSTVEFWHSTSQSRPENSKAESKQGPSSRPMATVRRRTSKKFKGDSASTSTGPESEETPSASPVPPASDQSRTPKGNNGMSAVIEFCQNANRAIGQNLKSRASTGYKDNNGRYHAMYRYGIGKILNLYCPPGITHLKCCDREFDLAALKEHVIRKHEANHDSEPSISPV